MSQEKSQQPKKHKRRLTLRDEKFVKLLVTGEAANPTQAARMAGFTGSYGNRNAHLIMNRPNIANKLKEYVNAGSLDDKAIGALNEILDIPMNNFESASDLSTVASVKMQVIKELNKIQGNYAPTKIDTRSAKFEFKIPSQDD